MNLFASLTIIIGLCLFEVVSSINNAIINAQVLSTMSARAKRWFLVWGLLIAVVLVRGLLPWLIVYVAAPGLGLMGSLTASFSSDPIVAESLHRAAPVLQMGGGIFLIFLFLHWIFLEPKNFGLHGERYLLSKGVWFYAVTSAVLAAIVWFALKADPIVAFGAVVGSTAFFITSGFKDNAEAAEQQLLTSPKSDISKILYLELLDTTFSVDGVLGAFAFTLAVPLILLGNGIGAIVVRQITVGNIARIKRYHYLENGAMYATLLLGLVMITEGFGHEVPFWVSPAATIIVVAYFLLKSRREPGAKA